MPTPEEYLRSEREKVFGEAQAKPKLISWRLEHCASAMLPQETTGAPLRLPSVSFDQFFQAGTSSMFTTSSSQPIN